MLCRRNPDRICRPVRFNNARIHHLIALVSRVQEEYYDLSSSAVLAVRKSDSAHIACARLEFPHEIAVHRRPRWSFDRYLHIGEFSVANISSQTGVRTSSRSRSCIICSTAVDHRRSYGSTVSIWPPLRRDDMHCVVALSPSQRSLEILRITPS